MTTHSPVPAEVEPDSLLTLVQDCRDISGGLAASVPTPVRPADEAGGVPPVEIGSDAVFRLVGYEEYGS